MLFLLAWALIITGLTIPPLWILRVWLEERLVSTSLALSGIGAHLFLCIALPLLSPWALVTYCALILLAIALTPTINRRLDRASMKDLQSEEVEQYLAALERQPDNPALHAALAQAYLDIARYDEAIASFEKAIALDPHHTQPERAKLRSARAEKQRREEQNAVPARRGLWWR